MIQLQPCFVFFFFIFSVPFTLCYDKHQNSSHHHVETIHIGVILDMSSVIGRVGWTCISMARSDFYSRFHSNHNTRLVFHLRDSQGDNVKATFAALDLLKKEKVQAIIGPQRSREADFMMYLGEKAQVPIISFSATSSALSSHTPYFVRAAQNDSSQLRPITAIIQAFKWREVIAICEDSVYGNGLVPYLVDALQDIQARVSYRSVISLSATDDQILKELLKLMDMNTKVFIVHMAYSLGFRFFSKAKEAGMMSDGYVWIVTYELMNLFDTHIAASTQGLLGVEPHIKRSKDLDHFISRWNKFAKDNPQSGKLELNIFGLWAYDAVWALALAAERVFETKSLDEIPKATDSISNLTTVHTSPYGQRFLHSILKTRFKGLSGDFHLIDGQLQSSEFKTVNVIGDRKREVGMWTPADGVSQDLKLDIEDMHTVTNVDFGPIVWPGGSMSVPKGWIIPRIGKKLRIGVPVKLYFTEFVSVNRDPQTNETTVKGHVIDVFNSVMAALPYVVLYEFIPFQKPDGTTAGNYNDLVYQVYLQRYDAVVGDVMITANRSSYVDFTLPYAEGGVFIVVPVKYNDNHNAWIFLKPLSADLWLASGAFFFVTGFVIWAVEHRINDAFRGPPSQQAATIFWFLLSSLVFAHRERVVSNMTRLVVTVWIFVVLILSSSYTASLSSMLTVQQLKPTITSIEELVKNGEYVGCQKGTFIRALLKQQKFDESKLKSYNSPEEYHEALKMGSQNGGITAYIDSNPYIKLFMAKYCDKYTVVGPVYKTDGPGFVFPKGSPLVADVSSAILRVRELDNIKKIDEAWFGNQAACSDKGNNQDISNGLKFNSFRALFIITGTISGSALLIYLAIFLYKHKHVLTIDDCRNTFWQRLITMLNEFDKKDHPPIDSRERVCTERSSVVREFEA